MKTAYLDPIGGIAGDMFLAALLDGGGDEEYLLRELKKADLPGWQWKREPVTRGGFAGTKIDFIIEEQKVCRRLPDITDLIQKAHFPKDAEALMIRTFDLLAEAEAKAHGIAKNEVHFHEVGAADTILDICGTALMLCQMGIDQLICGALPMGNGTVRCAHGEMPLPAPAVAAMLPGVSTRESNIQGETVTPTGLALLKAMNCRFGAFPMMTVEESGCGCGTRDGETPNILRIFIGEGRTNVPHICTLECTIDDMTGEELGFLWEQMENAGANDMYYTPVYMKKGRPAVKLTALCEEAALSAVRDTIFTHTTTLGMICRRAERFVLDRGFETVETALGSVRYKTAAAPKGEKAKAEFEDLKRIAVEQGISLREARRLCDAEYEKHKDSKK